MNMLKWVASIRIWLISTSFLFAFNLPERTDTTSYQAVWIQEEPIEAITFDQTPIDIEKLALNFDALEESEMDTYLFKFCSTENFVLYTCHKYVDLSLSLLPKIHRISDRIEAHFDKGQKHIVMEEIEIILQEKFDELETERAKYIISFVWEAMQVVLFEEIEWLKPSLIQIHGVSEEYNQMRWFIITWVE